MSVPGLERGIAILRLFARDRAVISATEFAVELRLPRSTVHRLLVSLQELGLVRRTESGRFALDAGILTLGHEYLASLDIPNLAAPVLETLRNDTNWSTHLAVRQGRSIIYLSRYASRAAVTRNVTVGVSLPAHATLMGRVLLADMEPTELRALFPEAILPPGSPNAPRDLATLQRMIDADRACGYAACEGFYEPGVSAVAAPVRDKSLGIVAAINATSVGDQAGSIAGIVPAVVAAAGHLSRLLGAPATLPRIGGRAREEQAC